jgi:PhzF family phenazine biosynthesis protein
LRWFTPTVEVELCGHATLASAHVLFEQGRVEARASIAFHTRSGVLRAGGSAGRVELDFPAFVARPADPPAGLAEALGAPIKAFSAVDRDRYLVAELDDAAAVREVRPDFRALGSVVAHVGVTAASDDDRYDFVSRYFAPGAGIDEDPVTGSAHCVLAPYWAERFGRAELTGCQASARGGVVHTRLVDDRVMLTGDAVTVWRGSIDLAGAA